MTVGAVEGKRGENDDERGEYTGGVSRNEQENE